MTRFAGVVPIVPATADLAALDSRLAARDPSRRRRLLCLHLIIAALALTPAIALAVIAPPLQAQVPRTQPPRSSRPIAERRSPLWGALEPGAHAIGFRQLLLHDPSRPAIGDGDGGAPAVERGRPMQIAIWYPARDAVNARTMPYGAYIDLLAQELDFAPLDLSRRRAAAEKFVAQAAGLGGDTTALRSALSHLAALPTAAVRGAPPAVGRFPLVLFPEWRTPASNSVMAEFLASHGYVVASTSLKGSYDAQVEVSVRGLETLAADLRFVVTALDTIRFVDTGHIGALGVGIAASGALALQMRTPAVRAFVSLEGGITTASELALLAATPYYDPAAVRVPLLAITAPHPSVDPARLDLFRHATRHLVHFPRMGEFWFLNFGMLEREVPRIIGTPPGDTRAGFEWGARWVRLFLDAYLRDDLAARATLMGDVARAAPAGLFTVARRDPLPPPPPVAELKRVIVRDGVGALAALVERRQGADSEPVPADYFVTLQQWLANSGRDPRGEQRHELAVLRARVYSRSSRAHFTLGMSALQRGDSALARVQLEEALRLLPADLDPGLDASLRARVEQQARAALERIRQ